MGGKRRHKPVIQWLSTFLKLRLFNTISHSVVTPNHKIILLLLHNYKFVTVMNHSGNIQYAGYLICDPQRGLNLHVENHHCKLSLCHTCSKHIVSVNWYIAILFYFCFFYVGFFVCTWLYSTGKSKTQRSAYLCFLCAEIKGMHHYDKPAFYFFN